MAPLSRPNAGAVCEHPAVRGDAWELWAAHAQRGVAAECGRAGSDRGHSGAQEARVTGPPTDSRMDSIRSVVLERLPYAAQQIIPRPMLEELELESIADGI